MLHMCLSASFPGKNGEYVGSVLTPLGRRRRVLILGGESAVLLHKIPRKPIYKSIIQENMQKIKWKVVETAVYRR